MGSYSLGVNTYIKARIGWQGLTTAEYLDHGDYYLVTGTDIKNGLLDFSSCVFVSKERFDQDPHIQLRVGDVLITKDGTIGKAAYVETLPLPTTLNSGVFVVRCNNCELTQKYFYYVLKSKLFKDFIDQTSAGSTIVHLYQKDIVKFCFKIPDSTKEQDHIVNIMESIDNLIDSLERKLEKYNNIYSAMLKNVFSNKTWQATTLGNIAKIYQPQTIASSMLTEYGYDVYGANGIIGKYHSYNHEHWQNLITCRGSTCGTINKTGNKVWINGNAMVVNVDSNKSIDKEFLYYLLLSCDFTECISGSGQPQIVRGPLLKYPISIPNDLEEQRKVANLLKSFENNVINCKKQIEKYSQIREGLLNGLFAGKINVPADYKEV